MQSVALPLMGASQMQPQPSGFSQEEMMMTTVSSSPTDADSVGGMAREKSSENVCDALMHVDTSAQETTMHITMRDFSHVSSQNAAQMVLEHNSMHLEVVDEDDAKRSGVKRKAVEDAGADAAEAEALDVCARTHTHVYKVAIQVERQFPTYTMIKKRLMERGWEVASDYRDADVSLLLAHRADFKWSDMQRYTEEYAPHMVNLCHGFEQLNKLQLMRNLREFAKRPDVSKESMSFAPVTFWLETCKGVQPSSEQTAERQAFLTYFTEKKAEGRDKNIWIVKPASGRKGTGIKVFDDANAAINFVDSFEIPDNPKLAKKTGQVLLDRGIHWVCQKYIEKPLLVRNRKFDLRVYALLAPDFKLYMCKKAVCRTASADFSLDHLDDRFVHLTNHCVQVKHKDYGSHESGNEMMMDVLDQYIQEHYPGRSIAKDVYPALQNMVKCTVRSIEKYLRQPSAYYTYQAFGFDVMITEDFEVLLLEVNTTPGGPDHLKELIFHDAFDIIIDPVFPANTSRSTKRMRLMEPKLSPTNSWELLWEFKDVTPLEEQLATSTASLMAD